MLLFLRVTGMYPRPVVILGPFAQALIQKLVNESPDKYQEYDEEYLNTENTVIEKEIAGGVFVDYKKVNDLFKVTRTQTLHKIASHVSLFYVSLLFTIYQIGGYACFTYALILCYIVRYLIAFRIGTAC